MKFGKSLSHLSDPSGDHMVKIVRVLAPVRKSWLLVARTLKGPIEALDVPLSVAPHEPACS